MKRSGPIKRYTELPRSKKKIPRINVERAKKRQTKYAAYLKSPEWRALREAALKRAEHRCEYPNVGPHPLGGNRLVMERCPATRRLDVHHVRYSKLRPNAALDDLWVLCRPHHEYIENVITPWRAARRLALRSQEAGA